MDAESWLADNWRWLRSICARYWESHWRSFDAEDLLLCVAWRIYEKWDTYRDQGYTRKVWADRVLRNVVTDRHRYERAGVRWTGEPPAPLESLRETELDRHRAPSAEDECLDRQVPDWLTKVWRDLHVEDRAYAAGQLGSGPLVTMQQATANRRMALRNRYARLIR